MENIKIQQTKWRRILSFLLVCISVIANITPIFATTLAGQGSYHLPSGSFDASKYPGYATGGYSLVTFAPKSNSGSPEAYYGSFIVASSQPNADKINGALTFVDNNTDMPYPKTALINDYVNLQEITGFEGEKNSFKPIYSHPFIIVNDDLPQVFKYADKVSSLEQAKEWALKTVGNESNIYKWSKDLKPQLSSLDSGSFQQFLSSDLFEQGQFVITVEPMCLFTGAPVPGKAEYGLGNKVLLTAAQLGIYDMIKFKGTGASVSTYGTPTWDSKGSPKIWSQSTSPNLNANLSNNAFISIDSIVSDGEAREELDALNIEVFKDKKDFESKAMHKRQGSGPLVSTPRKLVTAGGVWIASKTPKDPPEPKVAINIPKTDFQVEKPEVVKMEMEESGGISLEINAKGGYHPINEEYVWKYPEITSKVGELKVTGIKSDLDGGKNVPIEDGEEKNFTKPDYVNVGDNTLSDLVKGSKSMTPDEKKVFDDLSSIDVRMSIANDDIIKAQTPMSHQEFSQKNPDGTVAYPGIIEIMNDILGEGKDENTRTHIRGITSKVSGVVTDNPSFTEAELPPEKPISYEDFREDSRVKLELFVYTDAGEYISHYEKHIADVAKDNGIEGDSGFNEYIPMNLVEKAGTENLIFTIAPDKIKNANGLVITSRINWIDPKEQKSHFYSNDKYLKRSETLPGNGDDALGWVNNIEQITIPLPKPNLVAISITPSVDYDSEKLCVQAEGLIEEIHTPTITTTHTVSIYKMTSSGYELIKEHTETLTNVKKGDVVKFNNGEPWCTGISVPKNSTDKYYVTYEINKPRTQPDNESTYIDNKVDNTIDVSQGINWTAQDVLINAKNKTPDSTKSFTYDITLDGSGILASLKQDGVTKISAIQDLYISEDNKNWQKVASKDTGKKAQGDPIHLQTKLKNPIEVPANTSKIIYVRYCVNVPFVSPKKETDHTDNCVTNSLTLPGPNPKGQEIGFPSLSCTFTIGNNDTQYKAIPAGAFREVHPIEEESGRLTNVRYNGAEKGVWRSCGICNGEWKDDYGEQLADDGIESTFEESNGVHDDIEQFWKGSVVYNTWYLAGALPNQDPKDTIYKYKDKQNLDTKLNEQSVWYYSPRTRIVADCHCKDGGGSCTCDPCTCKSTEHYTVALSPMQEKEFIVRYDEEYTYNPKNSRTYSTEAKGTKFDKQITAGKGFQQTIRTRLITDYPGEFKYTGATVHSVATGKGMHNKEPLRVTQLEVTSKQERGIDVPNGNAKTHKVIHDKMERYATFQMVPNKNSKGKIREAYTSVNYPDAYRTTNVKTPVPLPHLNEYVGLKTYSIVNIENKTVFDEKGSSGDKTPKFGLCYKDNMIVLGNFHNDYWVKPIDREELKKKQ